MPADHPRQFWILLILGSLVLTSAILIHFADWAGSAQLHTAMEIAATIIALTAGAFGLVRYAASPSFEYLLIGAGLLGTGLLDGVHCIVSSDFLNLSFPSQMPTLSPWSWYAPRIYLSILLLASWLVWRKNPDAVPSRTQVWIVIVSICASTIFTLMFFALVTLPPAYYNDFVFGRPQELLPAIIFMVAFVGYASRSKQQDDPFLRWLVLALFVNFVVQAVVMSRAYTNFDARFDLAHLLKIFSYVCILAGMAIEFKYLYTITGEQSKELELVNQRFELAMTGATDGIWEWQVGTNDVWHSDSYTKMLGYEPGELPYTIEFFNLTVHPDDFEPTWAKVNDYLENGGDFEAEYRIQNKAGNYRWFRARGSATRDKNGKPVLMAGSVADIHDKKVAQERFELAAAGATDGLWDWDLATNDVWYSDNFAVLLGYEPSELKPVLDTFADALHEDDREAIWAAVEDHLETDSPYDVEYRLLLKNGDYRWFRARGASIRDKHGKAYRMAGSISDIHLQKIAQEMIEKHVRDLEQSEAVLQQRTRELEISNTNLEEFASVASHDLKAPLRGITHLAEWIREDENQKLSKESLGYFDQLQGRIARMERLLDDLLQYSRAGRVESPVIEIDTAQRVKEIYELLSPPDGFSLEINQNTPVFKTQHAAFDLTVRNLLGNAIKHHDRDDGRIQVKLAEDEQNFYMTVSDDGPGIEEKFHERIFKMFQTLRPRDEIEGSGMGLALVKRTIESFGGGITVGSQLGVGTTFRIVWPKM